MKNNSLLLKALNFAGKKHNIQLRKDGQTPYVIHPVRVFFILRAAGFSEFSHKNMMIATLLHDVLEDTDTSYPEIKAIFGDKVASIVNELSKPETMQKEDWLKKFINLSKEAKIIKMADRIDNLRDLPKNNSSSEWIKSYAEQADLILKNCGKMNKDLADELKNSIRITLKGLENFKSQ